MHIVPADGRGEEHGEHDQGGHRRERDLQRPEDLGGAAGLEQDDGRGDHDAEAPQGQLEGGDHSELLGEQDRQQGDEDHRDPADEEHGPGRALRGEAPHEATDPVLEIRVRVVGGHVAAVHRDAGRQLNQQPLERAVRGEVVGKAAGPLLERVVRPGQRRPGDEQRDPAGHEQQAGPGRRAGQRDGAGERPDGAQPGDHGQQADEHVAHQGGGAEPSDPDRRTGRPAGLRGVSPPVAEVERHAANGERQRAERGQPDQSDVGPGQAEPGRGQHEQHGAEEPQPEQRFRRPVVLAPGPDGALVVRAGVLVVGPARTGAQPQVPGSLAPDEQGRDDQHAHGDAGPHEVPVLPGVRPGALDVRDLLEQVRSAGQAEQRQRQHDDRRVAVRVERLRQPADRRHQRPECEQCRGQQCQPLDGGGRQQQPAEWRAETDQDVLDEVRPGADQDQEHPGPSELRGPEPAEPDQAEDPVGHGEHDVGGGVHPEPAVHLAVDAVGPVGEELPAVQCVARVQNRGDASELGDRPGPALVEDLRQQVVDLPDRDEQRDSHGDQERQPGVGPRQPRTHLVLADLDAHTCHGGAWWGTATSTGPGAAASRGSGRGRERQDRDRGVLQPEPGTR